MWDWQVKRMRKQLAGDGNIREWGSPWFVVSVFVASKLVPVTLVSCLLFGLFLLGEKEVRAGEYNQVLSLGDEAPQWQDLPGVDKETAALDLAQLPRFDAGDFQDATVVVVAFTCCSCPYAVDAEERLIALDRWLKEQGGRLVAINVNSVPADSLTAMQARAVERGFAFPFIFDQTQEIAKKFGAVRTPEFFVLNKEWRVTYMGALDNSPDGKNVSERYVEEAVKQVLKGENVARGETVPVGCRIRWAREKRGG